MHEYGDAMLMFAMGMMSFTKGMEDALNRYFDEQKDEAPGLDDPDIITSTYEEIVEQGDCTDEEKE